MIDLSAIPKELNLWDHLTNTYQPTFHRVSLHQTLAVPNGPRVCYIYTVPKATEYAKNDN